MSSAEPPRLSTWLLERLSPRPRRESLVGDLREQFHHGRSVWWYRHQVIGTIFAGLIANIAAHKLLAVRALVMGWSAALLLIQFAQPLLEESRRALFREWGTSLWGQSELLRQLWVYYGVPFVAVTCLLFMAIGWMVARLHHGNLPAIVVLFAMTLMIPGMFQAMETRRLLGTELWPGWGWGSFRWALVFHTTLSCVVYPLCAVAGGLWNVRIDDRDELPMG